jgi:hypothetical protein
VAEVFRQSVQPRAWSKRRRERVKECLLLQLSDFSSPEPLTLDVASLAGVPAARWPAAVARKVGQVLPLFASSAKLHRRASFILPLCLAARDHKLKRATPSAVIERDHDLSPTRRALLAAQALSSARFCWVSRGPRCFCSYLLSSCRAMNLKRGSRWEKSRSPLVVLRHRCPLHSLQVCQRPSRRLRSQGKNVSAFECRTCGNALRQREPVRRNEGHRIACGTLLR